jgi:hypothetical protein
MDVFLDTARGNGVPRFQTGVCAEGLPDLLSLVYGDLYRGVHEAY